MLEFLREEAEIDGPLDEIEQTGLVDILVLLEVELYLATVELQFPPLEIRLQELP